MSDSAGTAESPVTHQGPPPPPIDVRTASRLAGPAFVCTFLAGIPPLNLVALTLGIIAARRSSRFSIRAAIAWFTGGFFTMVHAIIFCGVVVTSYAPSESHPPGYGFLANADPHLSTIVSAMNAGDWFHAGRLLESARSPTTGSNWAFVCASAIVKDTLFDAIGSLKTFRTAAALKPDSAEFHYYFGRTLLKGPLFTEAVFTEAAAEFSAALEKTPGMTDADRYLALVGNTYIQSPATVAIGYLIILLLLFTVHAFAKAYTAWKLGDPTAMEQGRLSLNPLRHVDPFGSALLPGILILQQIGITGIP